jgi:hypothetical protein
MERGFPIYKQCIEHGINVLTIGSFASYPWRISPELTRELDEIAKASNVTITGTGNQDFFMVNLGTLMSGVCHRLNPHKGLLASHIHHGSVADTTPIKTSDRPNGHPNGQTDPSSVIGKKALRKIFMHLNDEAKEITSIHVLANKPAELMIKKITYLKKEAENNYTLECVVFLA